MADVGALAGSADGAYLLIGSTVYDVATKKRLTQLVGRHSSAMAMNKDGSKAVSVAADASVVLWDWQANLRFRQAKMTLAIPGNEIQYSPDGKFVALAIPKYHQGHVATAVRDARPVVDISTLDGEAAYILLLNASDGKHVKGMVSKIPAFERGTDPFEKDYGYGNFRHLEFSPDGKTLATLYGSGGGDWGDLVLWNIASARPSVNLMIRRERDTWRTGWTNVKYLKDGKSLLLLGKPEHRDEVVQTFNLDTSDVSATITGRFADSLLLLPGGQFASGFITYDYLNGEVLSTAKELPYQLVRTSGNTLVGRGHIGRSYDGLARWDLDTNKVTHP